MKYVNLEEHVEKQVEKIRTFRARTRFTTRFFAIVFPIVLVTIGFFYILYLHDVPLNQLDSPLIVTFSISMFCIVLGYVISYFLMNMIFHPLEELNSVEIMRNDFIANVSHEFKTPLSSLTGYVTLLQDPDLSAKERAEYVQLAIFNMEKLNDLTSNILLLSKLENQSTMPEPVTYRLDEQIREAIVLLVAKWSEKNIELDIDMDEITYTGQQSLLLQVWTNLIGNAIKFSSPESKISIRLKRENGNIAVSIKDHGIGMDENTQRHIFEKFYQGDSSRKSQGNGLGLPLCKEILKKCSGNIEVESSLGKGTTFTVTLL